MLAICSGKHGASRLQMLIVFRDSRLWQNVDFVPMTPAPAALTGGYALCRRLQDRCGLSQWSVAQHVGQTHNILAGFVENGSEQMAQVVREDLGGGHPGSDAQALHLRPDLPPDRGLPLLVRKISPEAVFCCLAYLSSLRHSLPGRRMVRTLPLRAISA